MKHLYFAVTLFRRYWEYGKERENISPPILYAEVNQGSDKNGEHDEI